METFSRGKLYFKNDFDELSHHVKALKWKMELIWPKTVNQAKQIRNVSLRQKEVEKLRTIPADILSIMEIIKEYPLDSEESTETVVKYENSESEEIQNNWESELVSIENNPNVNTEYNVSTRSESVPIVGDFDNELIDWIIENNHHQNGNNTEEDTVEIKFNTEANLYQDQIVNETLSQSNYSEEDSDQTLNGDDDSSRDSKPRRRNGPRVKRFKCPKCASWFGTKQNLERHTMTHTGEKPFKCHFDQCTRAYNQNVHLQGHIRAVHQGLWYDCTHCQSKFLRKDYLEVHIRTVHRGEKPYPCTECPRKFTQKCSLKKHLLVHSGLKPHACSYCDYRSTVKCNLKTHILRYHPDKYIKST